MRCLGKTKKKKQCQKSAGRGKYCAQHLDQEGSPVPEGYLEDAPVMSPLPPSPVVQIQKYPRIPFSGYDYGQLSAVAEDLYNLYLDDYPEMEDACTIFDVISALADNLNSEHILHISDSSDLIFRLKEKVDKSKKELIDFERDPQDEIISYFEFRKQPLTETEKTVLSFEKFYPYFLSIRKPGWKKIISAGSRIVTYTNRGLFIRKFMGVAGFSIRTWLGKQIYEYTSLGDGSEVETEEFKLTKAALREEFPDSKISFFEIKILDDILECYNPRIDTGDELGYIEELDEQIKKRILKENGPGEYHRIDKTVILNRVK